MKTNLRDQVELVKGIRAESSLASGTLLLRRWLSDHDYEARENCKHRIIFRESGACTACGVVPE